MNNILIIFLLISLILFGTILSHKNGKNFYNKTTPKIFDIFHKILPRISDNNIISILPNIIILLMVLYITYYDINIIYNNIYYFLIIFLIRAITINLTILPPDKKCNIDELKLYNLLTGHCYDKIFSGHFTIIFLLVLIIYENKIYTNIYVLTIFCILYALLILSFRYHYTIDIIVSIFIVLTIKYYFNEICKLH